MKSLFLILVPFFFCLPTHAEMKKTLEIENYLEERISSFVKQIDPRAQVFVKVELKEVALTLPGTSIEYMGSTGVKQIEFEDVKEIKVKILTSLENFPDWTKLQISQNFSFAKIKTEVAVEKYTPEMLERFESAHSKNVLLEWLDKVWGYGAWLFGFLALLISGSLFGTGIYLKQLFRNQVTRILGAMTSQNENPREELAPKIDERNLQNQNTDEIITPASFDLPVEGLVELFADCYWTQQDSYAKWLWEHLSIQQRQTTLENWTPMREYSLQIQFSFGTSAHFHTHPYYLKPAPLRNLNNSEIEKVILQNHSAWASLSPLRKQAIHIPLEIKLSIINTQNPQSSKIQWPTLRSPERHFDSSGDLGELSIEDDLALWQNSDLVPQPLRKKVSTLVWVALLAEEKRKALLSQYAAVDLASIWIAPPEALDKLKEVIPEKKLKLVESYLKTIKSSRSSEKFKQISNKAVDLLSEKHEVEDVTSKAS
jgi:hypothetical protein